MQVTVFGATGGTGSRVVRLLQSQGHEVVAVGRRPEALAELAGPGITPVVVDVIDGDPAAAVAGSAAVVWALGARFGVDDFTAAHRTDLDAARRAMAAAVDAGVTRWVHISSLMADRPEEGPPFLRAVLEAKGAADAALPGTGLTWTVMRPSGMTDDAGTGLITAAPRVAGRIPIARDDVAAVAVAALTSTAAENRAFDLTGGDSPIAEQLAALA